MSKRLHITRGRSYEETLGDAFGLEERVIGWRGGKKGWYAQERNRALAKAAREKLPPPPPLVTPEELEELIRLSYEA